MENNNKKELECQISDCKSKIKYNEILIICFMGGFTGVHRIIAKNGNSGKYMAILFVFAISLFTKSFLALTFSAPYSSDVVLFNTFAFWFSIFVMFCLNVWKTIDLVMIMLGKFKVENYQLYLTNDRPFFKTWSNITVIFLTLFSLVGAILLGGNFLSYITDNDGVQSYSNYKNEVSKTNELSECIEYGSILSLNGDEDRNNLIEEIESYGYIIQDDGNYIFADKFHSDENLSNLLWMVAVVGNEDEYTCDMMVSYDDNFTLEVRQSYDDVNVINVHYKKRSNEISIYGDYNINTGEFKLFYGNEDDIDENKPYDAKKDEFRFIDTAIKVVEKYIEDFELISSVEK